MILRLQHIGTAHPSHREAAEGLARVGLEPGELRTDQGRGFQLDSRTLLGNECWLHVVHNWNPEARVCRFLRERGPGLEHIAIETDDIERAVARVRERAPIFEDTIFRAADGFEAFVYPEDACGFTVELIQPHPESWNWPEAPPERVSPLLGVTHLAEVVARVADPLAAGQRFEELFGVGWSAEDDGTVATAFPNDCLLRFERGDGETGLRALVFETGDLDADRIALGEVASGNGELRVPASVAGFEVILRPTGF